MTLSPEVIVSIIISLSSTLIGVVIGLLITYIGSRVRFKKEMRDNDYIDISGDNWYAAWQTSIDKKQNLNTEKLSLHQRGQTVRMRNLERARENPKGGYLWEGQLQFFHGKSLMGWYFPLRSENITSKGIMYMSFFSQKKLFYGRWVGAAYDGALTSGYVVISKNRQQSLTMLKELIGKHVDRINIVYDTF